MEDYRAMYSKMHESDKVFQGRSIRKCVSEIAELVREFKPRSLIDYGCGKGRQYTEYEIHKQWGGLLPHCYDVGVKQFSKRPAGPFDGLLCVDVMEHIAEQDVAAVLADIFSLFPQRNDGGHCFAFFAIACSPARAKKLPDGRNVHLTVRPGSWWDEAIESLAPGHLEVVTKYETEAAQ